MKRLWTTFLGLCLSVSCAQVAWAQEGAPVSGAYTGGGFVGGAPVGGGFISGPVGGGCATGDCATGSCGPTGCLPNCQKHHCPVLYHCQEGGVKYKTHVGCARPVCNPCNNPGWGYFETCWNPWPYPPDYSHCRKVPPAAAVVLNPNAAPGGLGGYPQTDVAPTRTMPVPHRAPMPPSETRLAPPIQYPHGMPTAQGMPTPQRPSAPPDYTYQSGMPTSTMPVAADNSYQQQQFHYQQQPRVPQEAPASAPLSTESRVVPPVSQQPPVPQQPLPPIQGFTPRYQ